MPWHREAPVYTQCYPSGKRLILRIIGYACIGVGVLLMLLCVPYWAWLAVIGAALIVLGWILCRKP